MIIVTLQSHMMADLVRNGEGRDFVRLQEGKYIFYEQTTNICYYSWAWGQGTAKNSSKLSHLELVSKMNEKGGKNLLKTGKKH